MTPQETAYRLVENYKKIIETAALSKRIVEVKAKMCALACVTEIIRTGVWFDSSIIGNAGIDPENTLEYWEQVRKEIH